MVGFLGFNGILPMKNEIRLQQMMGWMEVKHREWWFNGISWLRSVAPWTFSIPLKWLLDKGSTSSSPMEPLTIPDS
jgi:hypothetical protein